MELGDEFNMLCNQLTQEVGHHSLSQVDRVNEELIRKALKMMHVDIQSDCFINGPLFLVFHHSILLRSFIFHVPYFVLLCTLLSLVKESNYRAIASGSLPLKLLDIVIHLLEDDKLSSASDWKRMVGQTYSFNFPICNGVRQSGIELSFCLHQDIQHVQE